MNARKIAAGLRLIADGLEEDASAPPIAAGAPAPRKRGVHRAKLESISDADRELADRHLRARGLS